VRIPETEDPRGVDNEMCWGEIYNLGEEKKGLQMDLSTHDRQLHTKKNEEDFCSRDENF